MCKGRTNPSNPWANNCQTLRESQPLPFPALRKVKTSFTFPTLLPAFGPLWKGTGPTPGAWQVSTGTDTPGLLKIPLPTSLTPPRRPPRRDHATEPMEIQANGLFLGVSLLFAFLTSGGAWRQGEAPLVLLPRPPTPASRPACAREPAWEGEEPDSCGAAPPGPCGERAEGKPAPSRLPPLPVAPGAFLRSYPQRAAERIQKVPLAGESGSEVLPLNPVPLPVSSSRPNLRLKACGWPAARRWTGSGKSG